MRKIGSGNIGATNVLRTGRKGLAAATLLGDALKGTAAVLVAAPLVADDRGARGGARRLSRPSLPGLAAASRAARASRPSSACCSALAAARGPGLRADLARARLRSPAIRRSSALVASAATPHRPAGSSASRARAGCPFVLAALLWWKHRAEHQPAAGRHRRQDRAEGLSGSVHPHRRAAPRLAAADPLRERRSAHLSRADQPIWRRRPRRWRPCRTSPAAAGALPLKVRSRGRGREGTGRRRRASASASSPWARRIIPKTLQAIDTAPPLIGVRGSADDPGTARRRHRRLAQRLRRRADLRRAPGARSSGEAGYVVVSGLARGHRHARPQGERWRRGTIAVLAGGP